MGESFNDRVIADFKAAGHTCVVVPDTPTVCFEIDGKYIVYRSLVGDFVVEDDDCNELGTFRANFDYYVAKATLKIIE